MVQARIRRQQRQQQQQHRLPQQAPSLMAHVPLRPPPAVSPQLVLRSLAVAAICLHAASASAVAAAGGTCSDVLDLSFSHAGPGVASRLQQAPTAAAAAGGVGTATAPAEEADGAGAPGASDVIAAAAAAAASASLPSSLLLQECSLGDKGALELVRSPLVSAPTGVTSLSLRHNHITKAGSRALLHHLRTAPDRLQTLVLDFNPLGDAGVQPLPALLKDSSNGQLRSLSLRFCSITAAGCRSIASALIKARVVGGDANTGILHLSLAGNPLGDDGARALAAALKHNVRLSELDLSHCGIGDEGAECLAQALAANTHLRHLRLSYNRVGGAGAEALAATLRPGASKLQRLDLDNNRVGDVGAFSLARALSADSRAGGGGGRRQRSSGGAAAATDGLALDLCANGISCEGCAALATALAYDCRLEALDLSGNPLFGAAPKARKGAGSTAKALLTKHTSTVTSTLGKLYSQFVDESYKTADQTRAAAATGAATALGRALRRNARLRRLGLAHTALSDAAAARRLRADALANEGELRWVDLGMNLGVGEAEARRLTEELAARGGAGAHGGSGHEREEGALEAWSEDGAAVQEEGSEYSGEGEEGGSGGGGSSSSDGGGGGGDGGQEYSEYSSEGGYDAGSGEASYDQQGADDSWEESGDAGADVPQPGDTLEPDW